MFITNAGVCFYRFFIALPTSPHDANPTHTNYTANG